MTQIDTEKKNDCQCVTCVAWRAEVRDLDAARLSWMTKADKLELQVKHLADVAESEHEIARNLASLLADAGNDLAVLRSERDILKYTVESVKGFLEIALAR